MKNKGNRYFVLFGSIVLGILFIFNLGASSENPKSRLQVGRTIKIKLAKEYQIFNEKGKAQDALVFVNRKTITGESTKELFVYFNIRPKPYVIVIAINQKLIGIPERYSTMKVEGDILTLQKESFRFTPINVGIEKMINNWSIEDGLIAFDTFEKLLPLGKRIIIKKNVKLQ